MPDSVAAIVAVPQPPSKTTARNRELRMPLDGEIVSGHADRHVVRLILSQGRRSFVAFLKREHRVRWRDRLSSWLAGYGWSSKSIREARVLAELRREKISAPICLGATEDRSGKACVLVKAIPGALDLRTFLHDAGDRPTWLKHQLIRRMAQLLAQVHGAGFDCPDLSSKHVLIRPRNLEVTFIDWQRTRRRRSVPRSVRIRELAALHATLAEELVSQGDRLRCLRTYLKACGITEPIRAWLSEIRRQSNRLLQRRWVRELRRPPIDCKSQRLRWIGGEHLCVTRHFWRDCRARVPAWLVRIANSSVPTRQRVVRTWQGHRVLLHQFPPLSRARRLWLRLQGQHRVAPGPRQAALIFRLERHDIRVPEVLAFGQRPDGASFILTRPRSGTIPANQWLAHRHPKADNFNSAIQELHDRLHRAGYILRSNSSVHVGSNPASPVLVDVTQVVKMRHRFASRG